MSVQITQRVPLSGLVSIHEGGVKNTRVKCVFSIADMNATQSSLKEHLVGTRRDVILRSSHHCHDRGDAREMLLYSYF